MGRIDNIYENVDDFGLITSAEARGLGFSNSDLVQFARRGKLERVARGVYRTPVWPYQEEGAYAVAVKAAGEGSFLYGESVVALLGLGVTDPRKLWIGVARRTRRCLGKYVTLVVDESVTPACYCGVPAQPLSDALVTARESMGPSRAMAAANEARRLGYLTAEDHDRVAKEMRKDAGATAPNKPTGQIVSPNRAPL